MRGRPVSEKGRRAMIAGQKRRRDREKAGDLPVVAEAEPFDPVKCLDWAIDAQRRSRHPVLSILDLQKIRGRVAILEAAVRALAEKEPRQ